MTKTQQVLDSLGLEELTAEDIAIKTDLDIQQVWMVLTRLKTEKRVETTDERKPFFYRSVTPKALLCRLFDIMLNKMEPVKDLDPIEDHMLELIETNYIAR